MADGPIRQFREFVDYLTSQIASIPGMVAGVGPDDPPIELRIELVLRIDDGVEREYHKELKRLKRRWRRL
jgi:hypothetical protein